MHQCDAASQGRQVDPNSGAPSPAVTIQTRSPLDEVLRERARRLLVEAVEQEVADYIEQHQNERDEKGHRLVVRNGQARERTVVTPVGPLKVVPVR